MDGYKQIEVYGPHCANNNELTNFHSQLYIDYEKERGYDYEESC